LSLYFVNPQKTAGHFGEIFIRFIICHFFIHSVMMA